MNVNLVHETDSLYISSWGASTGSDRNPMSVEIQMQYEEEHEDAIA